MKKDLIEVQNFIKNKNICILGNGRDVLTQKNKIDDFDVVCRMNRGFPKDKELLIGRRTDILFISTFISEQQIVKEFNPKYIIILTNKEEIIDKWHNLNCYQSPIKDWKDIKKELSLIPSTGCMSVYFLLKHCEFASLTIYGFDFFKTGTWYHNIEQKWHNGNEEEKLIKLWIKNKNNIYLISK
jgi:hypothetical protein